MYSKESLKYLGLFFKIASSLKMIPFTWNPVKNSMEDFKHSFEIVIWYINVSTSLIHSLSWLIGFPFGYYITDSPSYVAHSCFFSIAFLISAFCHLNTLFWRKELQKFLTHSMSLNEDLKSKSFQI